VSRPVGGVLSTEFLGPVVWSSIYAVHLGVSSDEPPSPFLTLLRMGFT